MSFEAFSALKSRPSGSSRAIKREIKINRRPSAGPQRVEIDAAIAQNLAFQSSSNQIGLDASRDEHLITFSTVFLLALFLNSRNRRRPREPNSPVNKIKSCGTLKARGPLLMSERDF